MTIQTNDLADAIYDYANTYHLYFEWKIYIKSMTQEEKLRLAIKLQALQMAVLADMEISESGDAIMKLSKEGK